MNKIGERHMMKCGEIAEIIDYKSWDDITVKFDNGYVKEHVSISNFNVGNIKNPYIPSVYGVGYIGEIGKANSKDSSYICWKGMIMRCYCESFLRDRPTYRGCIVCDEWHNYSNFKKWYDCQNIEDGMELDKDILIKGNKVYSQDTCVFVPQKINSLFETKSKKSNYPKGVCFDKNRNKYMAYITIDKKRKTLGYYSELEEAFYVYKEAKEKEIKRVADLYKDKIPQKLYNAMYNYEIEITD